MRKNPYKATIALYGFSLLVFTTIYYWQYQQDPKCFYVASSKYEEQLRVVENKRLSILAQSQKQICDSLKGVLNTYSLVNYTKFDSCSSVDILQKFDTKTDSLMIDSYNLNLPEFYGFDLNSRLSPLYIKNSLHVKNNIFRYKNYMFVIRLSEVPHVRYEALENRILLPYYYYFIIFENGIKVNSFGFELQNEFTRKKNEHLGFS